MKSVFLFLMLLFCLPAQALEKFSYSETAEFNRPKLIDILEVESELTTAGYWPIDLSGEQKLKFIGVDQGFFHSVHPNKAVLLKFGQKLSEPKLLRRLIAFDRDYLFHNENADGVPYTLMFLNLTEVEASEIAKLFGAKEKISLLDFIIPSANAAVCSSAIAGAASISAVSASLGMNTGLQRLWNCAMSAGGGAVSSVTGIGSSIRGFLSNPREAWTQARESFNQLQAFFANIQREVAQLTSALRNVDTDTALQIGCTIAGELLPGVIAGIATGAGAAPALARASTQLALLISKMRRISRSIEAIGRQRTMGRLRNPEVVVERVLSCAL